MSSLPETLPAGRKVIVTNLARHHVHFQLVTGGEPGEGKAPPRPASVSRLKLGSAVDQGLEDEPPHVLTLEPSEAAKWWPVLRRVVASATPSSPAEISLAIG